MWACVCETEPVQACWTAVRELSVVEASLIFELVISQGDFCYAGEHTRALGAQSLQEPQLVTNHTRDVKGIPHEEMRQAEAKR